MDGWIAWFPQSYWVGFGIIGVGFGMLAGALIAGVVVRRATARGFPVEPVQMEEQS